MCDLQGTPIPQKSSVESLLADLLGRRSERDEERTLMKRRKLDLEERKLQLEENLFDERKEARENEQARKCDYDDKKRRL